MPAKMMKLMPLPMPRSVMSSPIHITRMVPATSEKIMVSGLEAGEVEVRDDLGAAARRLIGEQDEVAVGLQEAHAAPSGSACTG